MIRVGDNARQLRKIYICRRPTLRQASSATQKKQSDEKRRAKREQGHGRESPLPPLFEQRYRPSAENNKMKLRFYQYSTILKKKLSPHTPHPLFTHHRARCGTSASAPRISTHLPTFTRCHSFPSYYYFRPVLHGTVLFPRSIFFVAATVTVAQTPPCGCSSICAFVTYKEQWKNIFLRREREYYL